MLDNLFKPQSIALIGASTTPGKVGFDVIRNMINSDFAGNIYPVNPKKQDIFGLKCYNRILDIPGEIDLAVFMIPPKFIPGAIGECCEKGADTAIVISAGGKETGPEGAKLERSMVETARSSGMRILGPNCLGVINTFSRMNATFAAGMPARGNIGFISQSGALCTAILDWSFANNIGFSKFVSLGNKADLDEVDLLEALGEDDETSVIIGYIEGTARGRDFIDTALKITKKKPVILIKSGTSEAGAKAATSHTGSMAGSEAAFNAAFRQAGVMRAATVEELFDYAVAFSSQPLPDGNKLAVITNAGGPGIMATDALEGSCAQMASFLPETVNNLKEVLPSVAAFYNPVDIIGDAQADRYEQAITILLGDPGVDGVIILLTPQGMTQIEETAKAVAYSALMNDKPIIGSFMGEDMVNSGVHLLQKHHIPNYGFPERAVNVFSRMAEYSAWRDKPVAAAAVEEYNRPAVKSIIEQYTAYGKNEISGERALKVLEATGLRIPKYEIGHNIKEAKEIAAQQGYPVVLKVASPDISHKSDVGGVKVGIEDEKELEEAYNLIMLSCRKAVPNAVIHGVEVHQMITGGTELVVGMTRDPQFGPLLMFGLGGIYVEIMKDVSFRVAPVSEDDIEDMFKEIKSIKLLMGARGEKHKDIRAVKKTLVLISTLITDFEEILEMDINPLVAMNDGEGVYAVDGRFNIKMVD